MQRKLTIFVDEEIYRGLYEQVGRDEISRFIEDLIRPHLAASEDLEEGYRAMAEDSERERAATEWAEGLIGDGLRAGG